MKLLFTFENMTRRRVKFWLVKTSELTIRALATEVVKGY